MRASFQQDEAVDLNIFHGAADDAGVEAVVTGEGHHVDAAGFRRKPSRRCRRLPPKKPQKHKLIMPIWEYISCIEERFPYQPVSTGRGIPLP